MSSLRGKVVVLDSAAEVAAAGAERLVVTAARTVAANGRCSVALAGGSTPKAMNALLADAALRERVEWPALEVFFGDERCVPPDHADSNYRMARSSLFDHVPIDGAHVHRIEGELPPADAAANYEKCMRKVLGPEDPPRIDLVFLGMGPDGHTASLFPGTSALEERSAWAVAVHVPKLDAWRVTLTARVLSAAGEVVVMLAGADKADALALALQGEEGAVPIGLVRPAAERMTWLCDRAAASGLRL